MAKLHSASIERRVLAAFLRTPTHIRALSITPDHFAIEEHKYLAKLIKKFVSKYNSAPSKSSLPLFAEELNYNEKSAEKIIKALEVLKKLPTINIDDTNFYFEKLENYRLGRHMYDVGNKFLESFNKEEVDFSKVKENLVTDLLTTGVVDRNVSRGYIYDRVKERWDGYNKIAKGDTPELIPFGIESLDHELGGMRKTFLTLMYSKTSGGKTRTAVSLAYNAAVAGKRVLYFTLEMAFNFLATCIDARMAWIDSKKIIFGRLDREEKKKYKKALYEQHRKKLDLWIVDIAQGATTASLMEEIELYRAANGVGPDLTIIDYANLVEPSKGRYRDRSEKYDRLFQEFHEMAKFEDTSIITATQESRTASMEDINARKKKDEIEEGVHNIGASNFMAPHCETVIRLKQSREDRIQNRLWMIIDKHRYAMLGLKIPLMACWETSYVGDRIVPGTRVKRIPPNEN